MIEERYLQAMTETGFATGDDVRQLAEEVLKWRAVLKAPARWEAFLQLMRQYDEQV